MTHKSTLHVFPAGPTVSATPCPASFLLPEILDCDFGPPEAPVASASAVLGKGGSHRDPEGFEHTL